MTEFPVAVKFHPFHRNAAFAVIFSCRRLAVFKSRRSHHKLPGRADRVCRKSTVYERRILCAERDRNIARVKARNRSCPKNFPGLNIHNNCGALFKAVFQRRLRSLLNLRAQSEHHAAFSFRSVCAKSCFFAVKKPAAAIGIICYGGFGAFGRKQPVIGLFNSRCSGSVVYISDYMRRKLIFRIAPGRFKVINARALNYLSAGIHHNGKTVFCRFNEAFVINIILEHGKIRFLRKDECLPFKASIYEGPSVSVIYSRAALRNRNGSAALNHRRAGGFTAPFKVYNPKCYGAEGA